MSIHDKYAINIQKESKRDFSWQVIARESGKIICSSSEFKGHASSYEEAEEQAISWSKEAREKNERKRLIITNRTKPRIVVSNASNLGGCGSSRNIGGC